MNHEGTETQRKKVLDSSCFVTLWFDFLILQQVALSQCKETIPC